MIFSKTFNPFLHRCQVYNWPFYAFLVAPLVLFNAFDWFFYVAVLITITRRSTVPSKESHSASFNHVFISMLLSLVFSIGWAFGFLSSSNVSRDAYLTGQYLFSILILVHTILQLILYLLRTSSSREAVSPLWNKVTCRSKEYELNPQGGRSNQYLANKGVETFDLDDSSREKSKDAPSNKSPAGSANQLADDKEAVTSLTNKEAMEASDEK